MPGAPAASPARRRSPRAHERAGSDLCVMHLEDEKGFVDACAKHGLEATSLVPAAGLEEGAVRLGPPAAAPARRASH